MHNITKTMRKGLGDTHTKQCWDPSTNIIQTYITAMGSLTAYEYYKNAI